MPGQLLCALVNTHLSLSMRVGAGHSCVAKRAGEAVVRASPPECWAAREAIYNSSACLMGFLQMLRVHYLKLKIIVS